MFAAARRGVNIGRNWQERYGFNVIVKSTFYSEHGLAISQSREASQLPTFERKCVRVDAERTLERASPFATS